jgi:hypothetical protein
LEKGWKRFSRFRLSVSREDLEPRMNVNEQRKRGSRRGAEARGRRVRC